MVVSTNVASENVETREVTVIEPASIQTVAPMLHRRGLTLPKNVSAEDLEKIAGTLLHLNDTSTWAMADLICRMYNVFTIKDAKTGKSVPDVDRIAKIVKLDRQTVINYRSCAETYALDERQWDVSFTHYSAVAYVKDKDLRSLTLENAAKYRWTKQALLGYKDMLDLPTNPEDEQPSSGEKNAARKALRRLADADVTIIGKPTAKQKQDVDALIRKAMNKPVETESSSAPLAPIGAVVNPDAGAPIPVGEPLKEAEESISKLPATVQAECRKRSKELLDMTHDLQARFSRVGGVMMRIHGSAYNPAWLKNVGEDVGNLADHCKAYVARCEAFRDFILSEERKHNAHTTQGSEKSDASARRVEARKAAGV